MEHNEDKDAVQYETAKIKELVREISDIAHRDIELNKEDKPAIQKLATIDTVYNKLLNKKIHEELLDNGILAALKTWLEPLADNSLPPEEVKEKILMLLLHLHPEVEHLVESGIGKIILFYSKNPYEKKTIQKMARQLVLKWIETAKEEE